MNDKFIKQQKSGEITEKILGNMENDLEVRITVDKGMYGEYVRQLGSRTHVASGQRWFDRESDMLACALYFDGNGSLSKNRPMTSSQIRYMQSLGIEYQLNWSVAEASQAIENKLSEEAL